MNEFFINKVEQLKKKVPATNIDPLENLRQVFRNREYIFKLRPVSQEEVMHILMDLKNTKSTGMAWILLIPG